jgi:cell division protein FtsB
MIMPTEENGLRTHVSKRVALPWESIDPRDDVSAPFENYREAEEAAEPAQLKPTAASATSPAPAVSVGSDSSPAGKLASAGKLKFPKTLFNKTPSISLANSRSAWANSGSALAIAEVPTTVVLERDEDGSLKLAEESQALQDEEAGDLDEDSSEDPGDIGTLAYAGRPESERDNSGWTITVLCVGLALIAACVVIPQADSNRRLAYEKEKLQMDLDQIQKQVAVNDEFLKKMESDPQLVQRLAQRQMRMIRQGETVIDLKPDAQPTGAQSTGQDHATAASLDADQMSPFRIVNVPPPPPLPPYTPVGGTFAELCRQPKSQLYLMGGAMFLVAAGLVLGDSRPRLDAETA